MDKYYRILYCINKDGFQNQRQLAAKVQMSVGSVNSALKTLEKKEYLVKDNMGNGYFLTQQGQDYLEEILESKREEKLSLEGKERAEDAKVHTAVILAAGSHPSFEQPIGLLPVNGVAVIEWLIRMLSQNGIETIYVVIGYKKELYQEYFKGRSNIVLVENNRYKWTGTMASLSVAAAYIKEDFLLLDGNQILEEVAITRLLESKSRNCVLLTNLSGSGDEALVELDEQGFLFRITKDIRQLNRIDAELVGVSRISYPLLQKMMEYYQDNKNPYLNYEYVIENIGRIYQITGEMADDMAWSIIESPQLHRKAEKIIFPRIQKRARLRQENQAREVLKACMHLKEEEIEECTIGGGMTNMNFFVKFRGKKYILRIAGAGTDVMIDRKSEQHNGALASALGLNPPTVYFDAETGVKITEFIEGAETLHPKTAHLEINIKETTRILKELHQSDMKQYGSFQVQTEYEKYKRKIDEIHGVYYPGFEEMDAWFYWMMNRLEEIGLDRCPCHNDLVAENFIKDRNGKMYLIDWEYSGYNDPMWDLAAHLLECEFDPVEEELFLQYYFQGQPDARSAEKIWIFKMCQDILWSAWTVLKEAEGDDFGSYGADRLHRAMEMKKEYEAYYGK
ncbi:MAG: phosphotransferase [Lachnospiraceae bacterium]